MGSLIAVDLLGLRGWIKVREGLYDPGFFIEI